MTSRSERAVERDDIQPGSNTGRVLDARAVYGARMMPTDQVATFQNSEKLFPTRVIRCGKTVPFDSAPAPYQDLVFETGGRQQDLYDYISRNRVMGLLILHDGKIAYENYEHGHSPESRWVSMSMAKSVSTTLVGLAIKEGHIKNVDEPLTRYLPRLEKTAFDGVSIRHAMQMTSGVVWDDTQNDQHSNRHRMLELQLEQRAGLVMDYVASLPRVAPPGTRWNYSAADTQLVGAVVHAATGKWLADYFSDRIWSKLGTEHDASWWLEAPGALEMGGSGISATLRDYARFGLFMMNGGSIGGASLLPLGWLEEATAPRNISGKLINYGYMWWPFPNIAGSYEDGAFSARGIFGQYLYINPKKRLVIAVNSARSKPKLSEAIPDNDFFNAVTEAKLYSGA